MKHKLIPEKKSFCKRIFKRKIWKRKWIKQDDWSTIQRDPFPCFLSIAKNPSFTTSVYVSISFLSFYLCLLLSFLLLRLLYFFYFFCSSCLSVLSFCFFRYYFCIFLFLLNICFFFKVCKLLWLYYFKVNLFKQLGRLNKVFKKLVKKN